MIWGEDVKELEIRLSHWERVSKEYRLQINVEKTVLLEISRKGGKSTVLKVNGKERKEVDKFVYLGSMVEKNDMFQNEIN
jgi:hypothetical protein